MDRNESEHADGRGRVLHRRPVRLILALVVAALLCAGGLGFWNYLQSYDQAADLGIVWFEVWRHNSGEARMRT